MNPVSPDITTDDVLAKALEASEMRFDDDLNFIPEDCYECCGRGWVLKERQGVIWTQFCSRCHGSRSEAIS